MSSVYSLRQGKDCVIYIRVSSERQVKGYSLEGQQRYLMEWAAFEGMNVKKVYVEPGKSGKSISGRAVFQNMLEDISTGQIKVDYVVVFKLSRFGRNAKDTLNSLTFLQKYGVNLICKEDGLDSSNAIGKMMITILSAVAEMERENILAQSLLGREEKARRGGWNGGIAPFGYQLVDGKLEINPEEASIVERIFHMFVNENKGYSTIAGYLNQQGILKLPAVNSKRVFTDWTAEPIKRMLSNPTYTGRISFGKTKQEKIEGTENDYRRVKSNEYILSDELAHEPIVSEELFAKAQIRQKELSATGNPSLGRSAKHLLSGILKCPMCQSPMYVEKVMWTTRTGEKKENLKYQCGHYAKAKNGQCKKNAILAEWVETEVIEYTKLLVRNKQFAEDIQKQIGQKVDASEIDAEIENYQLYLTKLERSKTSLERDIDNIFDNDKYAERKRKDMNARLNKIYEEIYGVEELIEECERKKEAVERDVLTIENIYNMLLVFDKIFDKMDSQDKRKIIESLISEIHLHPKETWKENKNPVKAIKYAFPVSEEVMANIGENLTAVETVALLSRVK